MRVLHTLEACREYVENESMITNGVVGWLPSELDNDSVLGKGITFSDVKRQQSSRLGIACFNCDSLSLIQIQIDFLHKFTRFLCDVSVPAS